MIRFDLRHLALLAGAVLLAVTMSGRLALTEQESGASLEKRQLALWGGLELERAVQALKDAILRGDDTYRSDFDRHMTEVERAASGYGAKGGLEPDEQQALARLQQDVPRYRAAIATVQAMRDRHAPITEIDRAVKGEDRPILAAFEALEAAASAHRVRAVGDEIQRVVLTGIVALALVLLALTHLWPAPPELRAGALRTWARRALRWEEERQLRAFRRLHEGVCQSLAGVLYLLRGADGAKLDEAGVSLRGRLEAILQETLRDTRAVALELWAAPAQEVSLDVALETIWADARERLPTIRVRADSTLDGSALGPDLRHDLQRLASMALEWASAAPQTRQLEWSLSRAGARVRLGIGIRGDAGSAARRATGTADPAVVQPAEAIAARIALSGGRTLGIQETAQWQALVAYWPTR